jgi:hypothetical protein
MADDLARALELAGRLAFAPADAAPWTREEQLLVAQALLAAAKAERKATRRALEQAARLLENLADKEVLRPDLVGTFVGIAADIRALAERRTEGGR